MIYNSVSKLNDFLVYLVKAFHMNKYIVNKHIVFFFLQEKYSGLYKDDFT